MNCQITTKELKDFNFFSEGYAKLFLKIFFYVSIIEFSFAPWFSLYSNMTRLLSNVLYLCWFASLFCSIVLSSFNKKRINKILPLIFFFIIYIGLGFLEAGAAAVFAYISSFLIPVMVACFLYCRKNFFSGKELNKFIFILNLCCMINCIYALYLTATFDGDFSKIYVAKADYVLYNYIRNNRLRAFGFLNSAVIFSNYVSLVFIINLLSIKKKKYFFARLFFLTLCIVALYYSGSRTPFLAIIVALGLILVFNKQRKLVFIFSILSIIFLLIFLSLGSNLDLSALGRISQYLEGVKLFIQNPIGYGFGYAGFPTGVVSFDCSILTIPINFGIIGLLTMLHMYYKSIRTVAVSQNEKTCNIILINLFVLSAFVNVVHLGVLTLIILCYFIKKQGSLND